MNSKLTSRGKLLLGLDIGTGSCKLKILDLSGGQEKAVSAAYPTFHPREGWAEQNPAAWWNAAVRLLQQCKWSLPNVECLALSDQMETSVPVMRDGKVLGGAIFWCDQRSVRECSIIRSLVGEGTAHRVTSCRIDPMHSGPKILWVKNHDRKRFLRTAKFLSAKEFMNHLLTGEFATDYSTASSSLLFDIRKKTGHPRFLEIWEFQSRSSRTCIPHEP
jgi:xylulokinase